MEFLERLPNVMEFVFEIIVKIYEQKTQYIKSFNDNFEGCDNLTENNYNSTKKGCLITQQHKQMVMKISIW